MEVVVPDECCYFGCEAESFHTLLYIPPPFNRTPRLCAPHSKSWRAYKSSLKRDTRWPEDFWPWADKELEIMKQQPAKKCYLGHDEELVLGVGPQPGDDDAALCAPCAESWARFVDGREERPRTREGYDADFAEWAARERGDAAPASIPAREAAMGQWYVVPSGEIEKCVASRGSVSRGQEVRVGFLHAGGDSNNREDIRWLGGDVRVIPVTAEDVRACQVSKFVARSDPRRVTKNDSGATSVEVDQTLLEAPGEALPEAVEEAPGEALPEAVEEEEPFIAAAPHKLSPLFSSESGEWQTDPDDFAWLNAWAQSRWGSGFVLDVCASKENALCNAYLTKERSCLDEPLWFGPWYMNPPYGDPEYPCKVPHARCKKKTCEKRGAHNDVYIPGIGDFVLAARRQAQEGRPGMCLLPFRPDTEWWRQCVLAPDGEQVAAGGDWAQGWSWVRWSSGLLVETRLISGRLSFVRLGGGESWTAPFPSVVVVFDRWK